MVWKWWQNESQVACEDSITGPLLDDNNPCWAGLGVNTITNPGLFKNASSFVMKVDTAGHTKITKQRKQLNITASTMKVCTLNWKVTPSSFRFFRWGGWLGINTLIPMVLITKHGDGQEMDVPQISWALTSSPIWQISTSLARICHFGVTHSWDHLECSVWICRFLVSQCCELLHALTHRIHVWYIC